MPTYDYECAKCGVFELEQRITEAELDKCPTCSGKVRRLISGGAGVAFKGSGFYITDKDKSKAKPKSQACAACDKNKSCGNN